MKQLISATLSEAAAKIYNSWPKQKKSAKLSEMIEDFNVYEKRIIGLKTQITTLYRLLAAATARLDKYSPKDPLLDNINDELAGTLYFDYQREAFRKKYDFNKVGQVEDKR